MLGQVQHCFLRRRRIQWVVPAGPRLVGTPENLSNKYPRRESLTITIFGPKSFTKAWKGVAKAEFRDRGDEDKNAAAVAELRAGRGVHAGRPLGPSR